MAQYKYKLTPVGVVVMAAMSGVTKLSNITNTSPILLEFYKNELQEKSEPQLTFQAVDKAIDFLIWHGLAKKIVVSK